MALQYGKCLGHAGVQVISGMARGIDGAGQRGTLNGDGTTFAVLGCGVDVCYPRENIGLYMDIQKKAESYRNFHPEPNHLQEIFRCGTGLSVDWRNGYW